MWKRKLRKHYQQGGNAETLSSELKLKVLYQVPDVQTLKGICSVSTLFRQVCNENIVPLLVYIVKKQFGDNLDVFPDRWKRLFTSHVAFMKEILKRHITFNKDDLLFEKAQQGKFYLVKFLLENGVNPNVERLDEFGIIMTPLTESSRNGHYNIVKLLLERQARNRDVALLMAVRNGHLDIVKLLNMNGANISTNHDEPLWWAVQNEHPHIVKYLVEQGANVHAQNDYALRRSARNNDLKSVKLLEDKGADIHAREEEAFRTSAEHGYIDIVKYLVEKGANIHVMHEHGFKMACQNGHLDVVQFLMTVGIEHTDLNAALIFAVHGRQYSVVKYLLENGATVDGPEALTIALDNEDDDIVDLLEEGLI